MGKKVNLIFAGLVFIALTAFLMVDGAEAFCIYNRTNDIVIKVKQTGGGYYIEGERFKEKINPGEHACCNWKNRECNMEGKRDSTVAFVITDINDVTICGISIPAGGWVEVKGKNGVYRCKAHGY